MRENLASDSIPFRKAYIQAIVSSIEVGDHRILIKGHKDRLERAILTGPAHLEGGSQMSTNWRAQRGSNQYFCRESATCEIRSNQTVASPRHVSFVQRDVSRHKSWSGRRESNPRMQLGKLPFYH